MTLWDDRILEIINDEGSGNATELADRRYIRVSRSQVSRRLKKLAEHGLLQPLGNGVYVITNAGEEYLEGELDANQLPEANKESESSTA